ncbi:carbonic anhydrase [Diplocarpon rosae]|nr:carbonic anhydrase [Diplocarpon rosae]
MFRALVTFAVLSGVLACPDHSPASYLSRRQAIPWSYDEQDAWANNHPFCANGTKQSPIDLPAGSFSQVQVPTFNYQTTVSGDLSNWGYGPSFSLNNVNGRDTSGNPSFTANGVTYYLLGFHTHIISEHTIDGQPHAAEIHLVHGDASGAPIGVVGFPLAVGSASGFFEILPSTPGIASTASVHLASWDMSKLLAEGNGLKDYWSYEGSLTTPDCAEGKRWWVSGKTVTLSQVQLDNLLQVSAPSARKTQQIIDQGLNI